MTSLTGETPDLGRLAGRGGAELVRQRAGRAWLLRPPGAQDRQAWVFAAGLAADPARSVVVVDLPEGPEDVLEAVVRALPEDPRGHRVVFGRTPRQGAPAAGRLLAQRLGRTVVVADGVPLPTSGGGLFISADRGAGWMRCEPGAEPVPESRRFPRPGWEADVPDEPRAVSRQAVAEPLPSGVWIRPQEETPAVVRQRAHLAAHLLGRPDVITVVVGSRGEPGVVPGDVARLYRLLPERARAAVRLLEYGDVRLPVGRTLGDTLADVLREPVRAYNGIPGLVRPGPGGPAVAEVFAVGEDGSPGRMLLSREVVYLPSEGPAGTGRGPRVFRHGWPLRELPEVAPGVHTCADDTVVEVVRSGLWVRSPQVAPAHAAHVRAIPPDPGGELVFFDTDAPHAAQLRRLAEEAVHRLGPNGPRLARPVPLRLPPADPHPHGRPEDRADDRPVAVQPVPRRSIVAGAQDEDVLAAARERVRSERADRYGEAAAFAALLLAREPQLGGDRPAAGVITDLAAARMHLTDQGTDPASVGDADPDEDGLALLRCASEGVHLLPVHEGPVALQAVLGPAAAAWYGEQRLVVDWAFCSASSAGEPHVPGATRFLIRSLRGRRTAGLDPARPDRVVFLPGTRFEVLRVRGGEHPLVMMRELAPWEIAPDREADQEALGELERAEQDWRWRNSVEDGGPRASFTGRPERPPGLLH
ncbi:hypothetical protein LO771_17260 [Streptacidiphilus sp. ASG 303]|uniref:hypothetical protein n=1 Tax=Streptacidiphilus sp. ASG 303 TaxID=2896847 RepID=UPI001E5E546B|nr:hypothetical protein [Streptacidiphilus sp. ASG 303]MCD0484093.1 hypothetical protein [Streptacidiphilus sp. ASG 303]